MKIFKSFAIAFSMYSKFPMPHFNWEKDEMKYALCFFPFIGMVIGGLFLAWAQIAQLLSFNAILFGAVCAFIPLAVTGGIHMDGYCDTVDALASYQPPQRRLEILKDSNAGAFAVIKYGIYLLLYFAAFTQLTEKSSLLVVALGFVLSRALSGLGVLHFQSANGNGTAAQFQKSADKKIVSGTLFLLLIVTALGMLAVHIYLGAFALIAAVAVFVYYRTMAYKEFGGITGDLAGYFLQLCEIYILYAVIIGQEVLKLCN